VNPLEPFGRKIFLTDVAPGDPSTFQIISSKQKASYADKISCIYDAVKISTKWGGLSPSKKEN
jgi:hypothetical protein